MGKRSKQNSDYAQQGSDNYRLFKALCDYVPGPDYRSCDTANEVLTRSSRRYRRRDPLRDHPATHSSTTPVRAIGLLLTLDEHCICFEMEVAGLMVLFSCIVIRGICDYAHFQ